MINELLRLTLGDNTKARFLRPDGSYVQARSKHGEKSHRSQFESIDLVTNPRRSKTDRAKRKYTEVKLAPNPFSPERAPRK